MMTALLRKELRGLRAFALAIVGLLALDLGYTLATEFPDGRPYTVARLASENHTEYVVLACILLGAGLLLREDRDRTLLFLDALPVSRTRIFVAKIAAGLLVGILPGMLVLGRAGVFGWLSHASEIVEAPPRFTLATLALLGVTTAYALGASLLLSYCRRWFALALGLLVLGGVFMHDRGVEWVSLFNPAKLQPQLHGAVLSIPWDFVWVQLGAAAGTLIAAWFFFLQLGMRVEDLGRKFLGRRWKAVGTLVLVIGTPVVWLSIATLMARQAASQKDDEEEAASPERDAFAEKKTNHYHFLFREAQREEAAALMNLADGIYAPVAEYLPPPAKKAELIVVDFASPVPSHMGGVATWTRIRLPLRQEATLAWLKGALAHETSHVLQARVGSVAYSNAAPRNRFFNEGLATHLELTLHGDAAERRKWDRLIAAVAQQSAVPAALLMDDQRLGAERDPNIAYPMGLAFCRALEAIGGKEAFAKVVRSFAEVPGAGSRDGMEVWRAVCAKAGVSLDAVIAGYDAEVASQQQRRAKFLARLPALRAEPVSKPNGWALRVSYDGKPPGKLVCRVEKVTFFGNDDQWLTPDDHGEVRLPDDERSVRYMLGWRMKDLPMPNYTPWREAVRP